MAINENDIKIIIAAELKKAGFDKAQKTTALLDNQFKKLGRTVAAVFSTRAIYNFGKEAVKAFSDDQQAAVRFEQALKGVNLGFASPEIERYLENLEKQTGVLKDQLRPAYQTLAQTTRSVNQSQDILNTAMDVAAGTGVDLQTVVQDLSKSYLGNNASLSKYNIGLSKTELRTTSFTKVQELLNKQFSGQRAAYLETYAGQVEILNVSYNKMKDTIGGALLDSFQLLIGENGIDGASAAMTRFGIYTADVIRGIGVAIDSITGRMPFLKYILDPSNLPVVGAYLDMFEALGKPQRPLFFPTGGIGQPAVDAKLRKLEEEAIKRQKELEKLRQKTLIEQEKANRLKRISIALMEKEKKFDLTRIQLQAALQGKLTDKERARVEELMLIEDIKQAVQEQNADKAEELLAKLEDLQSKTEKLALSLTAFPKANDPFEDWLDSLAKIMAMLVQIQMITNANTLAARSAASAANAAVASGDYYAASGDALSAAAQAEEARKKAAAALAAATTAEEEAAAQDWLDAADESAKAADMLAESAAALALAAAGLELVASADLLGESIATSFAAGYNPTNVTVNVAGNVTSERDLVDAVSQGLYEIQKRGQSITLNAVAI